MEIRELKAKDLKTLAIMLGKLQPATINNILAGLDKKKSYMEVGVLIFRSIAADITEDIYNWLADLIGKSSQELDGMPFNAPVEIIKALVARGDFADFFGQATKLAGKKQPSTTLLKAATAGRTKK